MSECKIGLVKLPTEQSASLAIQEWAEDWFRTPSQQGLLRNYGPTRCEVAQNAYNCILTGTIGPNPNENEQGYINAIQPFIENKDKFITFYNEFDREAALTLAQQIYSSNPTAETTHDNIISLFRRNLNDLEDNQLLISEVFESYEPYSLRYTYGREWKLSEEYEQLKAVLSNISELVPDTLDGFSTTQDTIELFTEAATKALAALERGEECAETLWNIEKEFYDEQETQGSRAVVARGVFGALPVEERVDVAVQALTQTQEVEEQLFLKDYQVPINFKEQCLFLSQIYHLVDYHKDKEIEDFSATPQIWHLPYAGSIPDFNSSIAIEGKPFAFINQLTQYPTTSNFFDATNAQIAHLQPLVRLFKVTPSNGENGFFEESYEFKFDTFATQQDIQEVFTNKNKRGFGAGIKNFNFTYDGSNPFSIKKSIKATLTIYANNFSELIKQRGNIRYIDLALKTGTAIRERTGDSELDFRIKAVVGLAVPNGNTTANFSDIMNAVKENYVTLNLTPVTHTFDFDETGAVTFKIEYYAYIEEFLDKARMNIFADNEVSTRVTKRRLAYKTARKDCDSEEDSKKLQQILDLDSENIKKDKIKSLQFLTNQLFKNNYIYYLTLTKEQLFQIATRGPFYSLEQGSVNIDPTNTAVTQTSISADLQAAFEKASSNAENTNSDDLNVSFRLSGLGDTQFAFFYLGDLLDIILKNIPNNLKELQGNLDGNYIPEEQPTTAIEIDDDLRIEELDTLRITEKKFRKFRFVLGPIEIVNHANKSQIKNVSLSDIPISLSYFNEWLTSKLLAKDEAEYPLTQFLNDFMNNFIRNYLNDDTCYTFNIKQKVRLFQNSLTSYGDKDNDNITKHMIRKEETRIDLRTDQHEDLVRPILQPAGPRGFNVCLYDPDQEYHFFIYYVGRIQPTELMRGDRCEDEKNGLFHYVLGKDRGIVKSIQLQKDETPGLKEVRFEQEGYDGLRQLREIYNVKIDTVANVSTFPGTYIFVEPRGFSPNLGSYDIDEFDLTDLGIGGYYMIINSTHEFAAGTMNTSFNARWVQSLESEARQAVTDSGDGERVSKCRVTVED